ncbi:MAG: c-type cytochrome [Pseudomonadota bacterium]
MRISRSAITVSAVLLASVSAMAAGDKADVENGNLIFTQRCGICHAVNKDPSGPVAGPNMVGILGRKAASVPGFAMYSEALKKSGLTWNPKTLSEFLTMPMQKVPGTVMPMMLPDDKERADVIAYMATLK